MHQYINQCVVDPARYISITGSIWYGLPELQSSSSLSSPGHESKYLTAGPQVLLLSLSPDPHVDEQVDQVLQVLQDTQVLSLQSLTSSPSPEHSPSPRHFLSNNIQSILFQFFMKLSISKLSI